jgi:hypothetical protein
MIRKVVLASSATEEDVQRYSDILKKKLLGTNYQQGHWELVVEFQDALDELAFQIATGQIQMLTN